MEYECPLIEHIIDETICYDIQMVTGNMINKRILQDYEFTIDENLLTEERIEMFCNNCPFNQLKQNANKMVRSSK